MKILAIRIKRLGLDLASAELNWRNRIGHIDTAIIYDLKASEYEELIDSDKDQTDFFDEKLGYQVDGADVAEFVQRIFDTLLQNPAALIDTITLRSGDGNWDEAVVIRITQSIRLPNESEGSDFFAMLRDLSNALDALSRYIKSINDPEKQTTELVTALAYIDSARNFIAIDSNKRPKEIPAGLVSGLLKALSGIDLAEISKHANMWVNTAVKLINKLKREQDGDEES